MQADEVQKPYIKWERETEIAANYLGWEVVETCGEDTWDGWGCHLLKREAEQGWAVMPWLIGTCEYCDNYTGRVDPEASPAELAKLFGYLITDCPTEKKARLEFDETRKRLSRD